MLQPMPELATGRQCNEKRLTVAHKALSIAHDELRKDTWSPDKINALAAIIDSCACDFDDAEEQPVELR